jgi:hypothetical protein
MSSDYLIWNELIFRKIFNKDNTNRAVSIYVDEELLDLWYQESAAFDKKDNKIRGYAHFIESCKKFLLHEPKDIATRISFLSRDWKNRGFKVDQAPTFIGLLALLVLASSWGLSRFFASSFYPRYWDMMGQSGKDTMIPDINDVRNTWSALQEWTISNDFLFGSFTVRTLSPTWKNVGIIIAQGLLRPDDEIQLRNIFFEYGADKELDYPDATLLAWISEKLSNLSPRARVAFQSEVNRELFLERIRQELEMWDGEPADAGDLGNRKRSLGRHALLCLVDKPEASFTIRVDLSSRDGEQDVLEFREKDNNLINLKAPSDGSPLSLPLRQTFQNDGISVQRPDEVYRIKTATAFSHFLSSSLISTRQGTGNTYKPSSGDLRIFAKIPSVSLTEYVEVSTLRRNIKHILLVSCNHEHLSRIEEWARRFSESSTEIEKYKPSFLNETKWKFIALTDSVREIDGVHIPQLRFEQKKIAKLEGGLRFFGLGNKYLKSLPPKLVFNTIHPVRVTVGGEVVDYVDPSAPFEFGSLLSIGHNHIQVFEITPEGMLPESAELDLSLHDYAEWTPEGKAVWKHESAEINTVNSSGLLLGCRTGQILPIDKSEGVNFTWSIHVNGSGHKLAIPCANLHACGVGIEKLISTKFEINGRTSSRDSQIIWMRTFREAKLHPLVSNNPDFKRLWEVVNRAIDAKVKIV